MRFFRKKGISLLVPTQNSEKTVELCLRSFKDFPDEIIVVDNGSTDNTIDIVKSLVGVIPNMKFFEVPYLKDLYENRQFAFEKSKYHWIAALDSDYVAYTSGKYDIKKMRNLILTANRTFPPTAFGITQVNLCPDFFHTGPPQEERILGQEYHIDLPINTLAARIIQCYPGMKFVRLGRWEGVRWQGRLNHILLDTPYWFHCNFKTKIGQLIRYYRNHWRGLGDFKKYPTRDDYIIEIIKKKYGTSDYTVAADIHWKQNVEPYMRQFKEEGFYPYPDLIKEKIKNWKQ